MYNMAVITDLTLSKHVVDVDVHLGETIVLTQLCPKRASYNLKKCPK